MWWNILCTNVYGAKCYFRVNRWCDSPGEVSRMTQVGRHKVNATQRTAGHHSVLEHYRD